MMTNNVSDDGSTILKVAIGDAAVGTRNSSALDVEP